MIFPPRTSSAHESLRHLKHSRLLLSCALLMALFVGLPLVHAQQASKTMKLSKIELTGLQRYSREQVIAASGLRLGQTVDVAALDAAANRLMGTGLFKNLNYRYRTAGDQATVTFILEEAKGGTPVVFDNFVWFTDEELMNAVRREMPSFDGTAPDSSGAVDTITRALERLLMEQKISGRVEYTPQADLSGNNPEHIFSVKGVKLLICALHFPGTGNVKESELIRVSKPLFETEYSRKFVAGFAKLNLLTVYRKRGMLRASFQEPHPKIEAGSGTTCQEGVAVTLPVTEGLIYSWNKAEWEGNKAIPVEKLETSLGMKAGELADGSKISGGLEAVQETYGKQGFIAAKLIPAPSFEDASRLVTYHIKVTEGPQFRMGSLIISGLSEQDANRLKEKWKLAPGEVFDTSYLREFVEKFVLEDKASGTENKKVEARLKPDQQKLTVDVSIGFK